MCLFRNYDDKDPVVDNDIAIGVLKRPLSPSEAEPICLGKATIGLRNMTGAGWGLSNCSSTDGSLDTLRKASVNVTSPDIKLKKHCLDQT